jgi:glycosyltransferase involved in cell wall biosynthesis
MPFKLINSLTTQDRSGAGNAAALLTEADEARDQRRWSEAASFYSEYLKLRPNDAAIWVQYAHALKESGNLDEAETAYRRSLTLSPKIADTHLQLGHICKLRRNYSGAISAYWEALRIDRKAADARRELEALGISTKEDIVGENSTSREVGTYIDLSDVFFYLRHHPAVTGIQRVQLGIAQALLSRSSEQRSNIHFISETYDRRGYAIIEEAFIRELCRELARGEVDHDHIKTVMNSALNLGNRYEALKGDTLLILGAFWVLEDIADIIALSKKGVYIGVLIHDVIPITHSEYVVTNAFKRCFFGMLRVVDFIMTVSDYTGQAVKGVLKEHGISAPPLKTLNPAHVTWEAPQHPKALSAVVSQLIKEDFVLFVSTIEVRKNHSYLFYIWKRLIQERGYNKVPRLVFVGRPGWRVKDFMEQLDFTSNLNGRIRILHDLSDSELAALYRSAMFTVFPSLEEGWGLPVGESMVFGRPCIASKASSIPEVAGEFADYIDPLNVNDGYTRIVRLIDDESYREQRANYIKSNFKPRVWDDVADELIENVDELIKSGTAAKRFIGAPKLEPGRTYHFGHMNDIEAFIKSGDAEVADFCLGRDWHVVEDFGRWMREKSAELEFSVCRCDDQIITVMLGYQVVHWAEDIQLQVTVNGQVLSGLNLKRGKGQFMLFETVPQGGNVIVQFEMVGKIPDPPEPEKRKDLCFGVTSVSFAIRSDLLSRVMLLEAIALSRPGISKLTNNRL